MAQTYFPFDAGQGANIMESQWQQMAQNFLGTGVIKGMLNELSAYADSTGMQVKVKTGQAWMKGHFYQSDTEVVLGIGTANATNPRIDRVILRVDWTANTIALAVIQGTPAATPAAPALTQNVSRWEISLAQVYVAAAASTIASGNITDERYFVKNANVMQANWTNAVYQNGWKSYSSPTYPDAGYKIDDLGKVYLIGFLSPSTATSGVVFTLPAGLRPPKALYKSAAKSVGGTDQYCTCIINPDGTVNISGYSGASWVNLNDISFFPF